MIKGHLTIGSLLIFAQYYFKEIQMIEVWSVTEFSIEQNKVYYDKVIAAATAREMKNTSEIGAITEIKKMEFKHVNYSYGKRREFQLKDIELLVEKGEKVALVGESGGGKTTIIELLLSNQKNIKGDILINGKRNRDFAIDSFYQRLGAIRQDSALLNMSIRDNLLLAKSDVEDEQIVGALKLAGIKEFVYSLEEGLDTVSGEKGIKLSGGQRQRLLLARIFLRDSDLYIFDEATSSLDSDAEVIIKETIDRHCANKLILNITHKISLIKSYNRIYVVRKGRIEAMGTHDELLKKSLYYRDLYEQQQSV